MAVNDKLQLPFMLIELCKYQQHIIDIYKDYIERTLHEKIKEKTIDKRLLNIDGWGHYTKVSIPQVTFMVDCSEDILREWEVIKHELPQIDLNFFIAVAAKQREELMKQCQN